MRTLKRRVLEEALEAADLFVEDTTDGDDVTLREDYKGRGYGPSGFGIVVEGQNRVLRLMTALGHAGMLHEADLLDTDREGDFGSEAARRMAKAAEMDSMGRYAIIVYFPGWKLED
jgi:hypothetical protein